MSNHNATVDCTSKWLTKGKIPHMGGRQGVPKSQKSFFSHITQGLNSSDLDGGDHKVLQKDISGLLIHTRSVSSRVEGASKSDLALFVRGMMHPYFQWARRGRGRH